MSKFSHEDTMISSRPRMSDDYLASDEAGEGAAGKSAGGKMLNRCRAMFRALGEQMSSFELSRQIYG
jgi:hypothetical protein